MNKQKKLFLILALIFIFSLSSMLFSNVKATEKADLTASSEESDDETWYYDSEDNTIVDPIDENATETPENTQADVEPEIHDGDLYEFTDKDYVMDKMVDGNVFIMGNGNVTITGQINGSLYVLAREVNITSDSYVADAVYTCATSVKLDALVYYFYVVAQNLEMGENAYIQRDLRATAQNSTLLGTIYRNAFISSGTLNYKKDESSLLVYGNIEYSSKDKIDVNDEKTIVPTGTITYNEDTQINGNGPKNVIGEKILDLAMKIVFAVVLYVLFTFFAPKFTEKLADCISNKSLKTILYGLLGVIAIPFASILLLVTVIGLPLAFILLGLYVMIFVLSTTITVFAVSNKIAGMIKLDKNIWTKMLSVALIVVVLYLLKLIPIVSSLVSIVAVLLGFGIIICNTIKKE